MSLTVTYHAPDSPEGTPFSVEHLPVVLIAEHEVEIAEEHAEHFLQNVGKRIEEVLPFDKNFTVKVDGEAVRGLPATAQPEPEPAEQAQEPDPNAGGEV